MWKNNVVGNILGNNIKIDRTSLNKRACKYCGKIHKNEPFTDCHNPEEPLPDSLEERYKATGWG